MFNQFCTFVLLKKEKQKIFEIIALLKYPWFNVNEHENFALIIIKFHLILTLVWFDVSKTLR